MSKKNTYAQMPPVAAFAESVRMRDKKDLIVRGSATALIILMPIATLILLEVLIHADLGKISLRFEDLRYYENVIVAVPIMIEAYIIMFMSRKMYVRLRDHAKRDRIWRDSLIRCAAEKGHGTARLTELSDRCAMKEKFPANIFTTILMVAMFIFLSWAFIYGMPERSLLEKPENITAMALVSVGACMLMFMLIFFKTVGFAYKHEKRQSEFTEELAGLLAQDGIMIRPMAVISAKGYVLINLILMYLTGGAWTIFLLFKIFRSANDHITNQWVYEEELLKALETDGKQGFRDGVYGSATGGKNAKKDTDEYRRGARRLARLKTKMPFGLYIAELFLLVICSNYIFKLVALVCDMSLDYRAYTDPIMQFLRLEFDSISWPMFKEAVIRMSMVLMNISFLTLTIGSLLGIASRRSASWRKVTRSCVTFAVPTYLSLYIMPASYTALFTFNPYVTAAVLWDILLMMIVSHSIREFYAPVGVPMPGITKWIAFILHGTLGPKEAAEIAEDIGTA